ncbi:MAG: MBL fold metallo-hydrolase [Pseudomonadota bacterium]|nr:MBL fold metallo-hydrolase [Pseudomonadota bacterium]
MAARGGRWRSVEFPALCGLIQHPAHGWLLYDTGYAEHFFTATSTWPEALYRHLLPTELPENETLHAQLAAAGLTRQDIKTVVISHYHGDHIAGLRDFPQARFMALKADTEQFLGLQHRRWRATLGGYLPRLLPDDFMQRLTLADTCAWTDLPQWLAPFTRGLDLLGDGSVLGIPLPGHSAGQMGLFLPNADGQPVFLVGDACWSLPALREGRLPALPAQWFMANRQRYHGTFTALMGIARKEPAVALLPSHCLRAWQEYADGH